MFVTIKNKHKFKQLERQVSQNANSNSTFDVNDANIYGILNTKNFLRTHYSKQSQDRNTSQNLSQSSVQSSSRGSRKMQKQSSKSLKSNENLKTNSAKNERVMIQSSDHPRKKPAHRRTKTMN